MVKALAALAGFVILAGCSFSSGVIPASEPNRDDPETIREEEQGFLTGLFTRDPLDFPDAVPVPMREAGLERGYGGVIIRATGVAPTQGWHGAAIVPENGGQPDAAGVITVSLIAIPPFGPEAVGPERTRLLLTGAFVQNLELRNIRAFRLVAANQSVTLPVN